MERKGIIFVFEITKLLDIFRLIFSTQIYIKNALIWGNDLIPRSAFSLSPSLHPLHDARRHLNVHAEFAISNDSLFLCKLAAGFKMSNFCSRYPLSRSYDRPLGRLSCSNGSKSCFILFQKHFFCRFSTTLYSIRRRVPIWTAHKRNSSNSTLIRSNHL